MMTCASRRVRNHSTLKHSSRNFALKDSLVQFGNVFAGVDVGDGVARGFPPYDARGMVKLLVCGYAVGVCPSRKLERASYDSVAVRMLCADQHPDYRSIARFRRGICKRWGSCSCGR